MASIPAPVVEPQASISPIGRIIGMFFSPGATFQDIAKSPSYLLPIALMLIIGVLGVVALNSHFNWREYNAQQIEKSPRSAQLSPEQKQQQIEMGTKFAPKISYVFGTIIPVLVVLVIALVYMGAYNLLAGVGTNFKTSVAIVAHALIPATIVGTILFVTVLFLKPVGMFDLENPVATNLAAVLPDDSAKWLVALCKNVDLLDLWKLLLISIGFAAVNPKKLKGGKAFTIAISVFLVYVVIRVGIAFIFS